jgi:EAL domain-containing protein (putative c-di-GMP-specific phosphodiesterase class I)
MSMTTPIPGGMRVLVIATDVDIALQLSRRIEEAGMQVRATTEFGDFVQNVQTWQPTHVAVAVGSNGDPAGPHPGVTVIPGGVMEGALDGGQPFAAWSSFGGWTTVEDLDDALDLGRLSVAYQPKIDTRAGAPFALEALARWHRPDDDSVPPDDFVTLAEIAGRIERLTDVVFGKSIRWFARHLASSRLKLCLNLSARSLTDPDLPDRLERMCGDAGLEPHRLVLEITETSIAGDAGVAHDVLIDLRRRGLGIALDDFGAGHASLLELARHPFSDLKIDRSLIRSVATEPQSRTIVEAIVGLAAKLGMRVIAEGVEDEATRASLEDLGCHLMQGNYLAPAMEPRALLDWLARRGVS